MYGGYPGHPIPPAFPPGYPPPVYIPRPTRSLMPRVLGILGIIFAVIGFGMAMVMTFGPLSDLDRWEVPLGALGGYGGWIWIYVVLSILIMGAHIAAGITATLYKPVGPMLSTIYGAAALAVAVLDVVLALALIPHDLRHGRVFETLAIPRLIINAFSIPWPILMLVLMNARGAKAACRPAAPAAPAAPPSP